jgi:hypothetical protein
MLDLRAGKAGVGGCARVGSLNTDAEKRTMQIYYLTSRWKVLSFLSTTIYAGIIMGTFSYFIRMFAALYMVMGVVVLIATVYALKSERIIVTPKGIEYHVPLTFAIEASWGEMEEIRRYWLREGLFVDRNSINIKYANRNTYATFMGFGQSAFIPLSSFSENWRDSELGQQIKQYAPHLFQ